MKHRFIAFIPSLLVGYLLVACAPFSVTSARAESSCYEAFEQSRPTIYDTSGFDVIEWPKERSPVEGWGLLKQHPILTESEVATVRAAIGRERSNEITFRLKDNPYRLSRTLGPKITEKIYRYVGEIESEIKKRTSVEHGVEVWIRREDSRKFESGHTHMSNTLTITRAEVGEGSWFDTEEGRLIPQADEASIFTSQFHGGTPKTEDRLLIIVFVDFGDRRIRGW